MTQVRLPASGPYTLSRARLHGALMTGLSEPADSEGFVLADLSVADGRIAAISPHDAAGPSAIDLAGRVVLPCFVDCHTHLDKGHIWQRTPNPDGSFMGAITTADNDRITRWNAADLTRRMDFALRCAYAHGTKAVRTHIDSIWPQETISWPVFEEMRERWRGRIALQAASLTGIEAARDREWFSSLARRVVASGGVLGAFAYMTPDIDELLDFIFALAAQHGLDLDFHADETADTSSVTLRKIAEAAARCGFAGSVLVGHCCALSRQPDSEVLETLDKVARAGLAVVSLPMCNLYLQDRRNDATTPRWRGVTLLHEMKARGIPVALASDNTRDPFYAYGDLDMLEVYRVATRVLHLDHPVDAWPKAATATPAQLMGFDGIGTLAVGGPADFILFRGRSISELLSRPESDRIVVRDGQAIDGALPDYCELDDLMKV